MLFSLLAEDPSVRKWTPRRRDRFDFKHENQNRFLFFRGQKVGTVDLPRRALVTGITGQDGSYLAELLLSKGYQVHGLVRRSSLSSQSRLSHLCHKTREERLKLHYGDLADGSGLTNLVLDIEPDEIYNLAAQSHVRTSFDKPVYTVDIDALGVLRMLEATRQLSKHRPVRFYQASSSEMFGNSKEALQNESTPFRPRSPYACAKVYGFHQTVNYREAYGLFACNGILFNHESPRRGETFVTRKITRAVGKIREGLQKTVLLGNLDSRRDWGFAGDYVDAMWRMLQQEIPEDFVVATGTTHSVRDFLELAFHRVGLNWQDYVEHDPRFLRPTEIDVLQGDATHARQKLGWTPGTSFEQLAVMMVDADWKLARDEKFLASAPRFGTQKMENDF